MARDTPEATLHARAMDLLILQGPRGITLGFSINARAQDICSPYGDVVAIFPRMGRCEGDLLNALACEDGFIRAPLSVVLAAVAHAIAHGEESGSEAESVCSGRERETSPPADPRLTEAPTRRTRAEDRSRSPARSP